MAITATETVEGHQRATGPDCTPAPGIHRALACVALAAIRPIDAGLAGADADTLRPQPVAGIAFTFPLAALRRRIRIQGDHPVSAICRPGSQAGHLCIARARIGRKPPSLAKPLRLTAPRKRRRLAVDPAGRLQHQAR